MRRSLALVAVVLWVASPGTARAAAEKAVSHFEVRGELATGFSARFGDGGDATAFELGRAELGLAWGAHDPGSGVTAGLVLQVDGVRSAGPESLLGIDGDAVVLAVSRAYGTLVATVGGGVTLRGRLGVVPDPMVASVEAGYGLRGVAPLVADGAGFYDRSDLGFSFDIGAFDDRMRLRVAATNGEGAHQLELDDRPNVQAQLEVVPWTVDWAGAEGALAVVVGWRDGSRGAGGAADDRVSAAAWFQHPRLDVGAELHLAQGFGGRGGREALGVGVWARAEPWKRVLGVYARYDWVDLDRGSDDAAVARFHAGVYHDFTAPEGPISRFRVSLGYRGERFGGSAGAVAGVPSVSDADVVLVGVELIAAGP